MSRLYVYRRRVLPRPEGETVLFVALSLSLILALVAFAVPPALALGLMAWAWVALSFSSRDLAELATRQVALCDRLHAAEAELAEARRRLAESSANTEVPR
jgi:hypothetical protein